MDAGAGPKDGTSVGGATSGPSTSIRISSSGACPGGLSDTDTRGALLSLSISWSWSRATSAMRGALFFDNVRRFLRGALDVLGTDWTATMVCAAKDPLASPRAQIARVRRSPNALTSGRRPNVQHSVYLVLDSTHQRTRSVPSNGYRDTSMATDPPGPTSDLSDSRAEGMSIFALSSFTFLTLIQRYGPLSIPLPLGKAQARKLHRKRMSQSYPTNLRSCSGMSILLKGAWGAMSGARYVPLLVYNNFRFHCDAALERRRPSNSRDY
jgi:hypothetical protein